jgi:hypothetical protein
MSVLDIQKVQATEPWSRPSDDRVMIEQKIRGVVVFPLASSLIVPAIPFSIAALHYDSVS